MNDLISIIVNIYNNEKTIRECIISLIAQTYRNIEIILIDDGSQDSSGKICDDLVLSSSKMKIIHQMHSGIDSTRNVGIDMCLGKYVIFVNGSDRLKNDMVETLYKMIISYPADISMCSIINNEFSPIDTSSESNTVITLDSEDALRQLLLNNSFPNTVCGKLFQKSLFKGIKKFYNADTLMRLIENSKKIAFTNKPLYLYNSIESFSSDELINRDLRIKRLYPNLDIYCQYDILKNIQNEFFYSFCNNVPLINADNLYNMFTKIVDEKEYKLVQFLSTVRKAHMYLLYNDLSSYKRLCPVLPELNLDE